MLRIASAALEASQPAFAAKDPFDYACVTQTSALKRQLEVARRSNRFTRDFLFRLEQIGLVQRLLFSLAYRFAFWFRALDEGTWPFMRM